MEDAIGALKSAMSNNPTSNNIHELGKDENILDYYNPNDCIHYRKETVLVAGKEKTVRRAYYYKSGCSSAYCNVGWVLDIDCDSCLKCNHIFSMFAKKHHCRICGDIVCDECSNNKVLIAEFRDYGPVRACNQCYFGQEEISVKKEEHIIDILRKAEEYTLSQKDQIEEDVVETATWQADFQEVESVARRKAAQFAQIASETASLRASMISASANSVNTSPDEIFVFHGVQNTTPNLPRTDVLITEAPTTLTTTPVTIHNHEQNVLQDLELIEKRAIKDMNKYLSEADEALRMQKELAYKVRELETQVHLCDEAASTAHHLKEEAEEISNSEKHRLSADDLSEGSGGQEEFKGQEKEEVIKEEEEKEYEKGDIL